MDESSLRARADALLAERAEPSVRRRLGKEDLRRLVHELHVHQIELELQNDELQATQRRLEDARSVLGESERRYRELFERAPVGYLRIVSNGPILEANQSIEELLGAESGQLTGRKLYDFVLPSHKDAYFLHREAAFRGESPQPLGLTLRTLRGELRDVEVTARLCDPDSLHVAIHDVSARGRAESERHEMERQRHLLTQALPVAVGYVGADGRLELSNQALERLLGSAGSASEGRSLHDVLPPDSYAALREHVRAALGGDGVRFEGTLSFPAVGSRVVSVLLAPDGTPPDPVRGFWALIGDRTELEQARRGLRNAAAQVALAEERERRALAADLHDDVGQLLALVSIKLRELEGKGGRDRLAGRLAEVENLTRQARESIASLTFELSPPLLYDVGFVATAEWLVENLRRRYGLRTEIETRGQVTELDEATRVTLYRSLRELLINVAKHSGTNEAHVLIEGSESDVTVTVRDHGFGFEPQALMEGFGLRSIRDRIESLGGRMEIDAAPRSGARIILTVPAGKRS